jgi:hypothetical protein
MKRFVIESIIILYLPLFGIGILCGQIILDNNTCQSKNKEDRGNALLITSYIGIAYIIIG